MGFGDLSQWRLTMRTLSRTFRDLLARDLPGLSNDERYWAFLEYLLFTDFKDARTGDVCVPSDLVKQIGGTQTASQFLDEFSGTVMPLSYSDVWSYSEGRCRTLTFVGWPAAVIEAREAEARRQWQGDERVYLRTGQSVTPRSRQRQRAELQKAASAFAQDVTAGQKLILEYLHARASNQFSAAVRKNRDAAYIAADKLEDREAQNQARLTINSLMDQPKPFYKRSRQGKTTRLFPVGDSLATLPSSIRRALLGDWYELDLKSAQFAIAAKLCNIETINNFLQADGDVWRELVAYLGARAEKAFLKERVYQIINGGSKRFTKQMLDLFVGEGAGDHFFAHPFMDALWRERRVVFSSILQNRGAVDAFGDWIALEWVNRGRHRAPDLGSVVSQQAQSYELKLLLPVYELAVSTDEFTIMLHQHDGLTIAISDRNRVELWLSRIVAAVQGEADALGIHTRLVLADRE